MMINGVTDICFTKIDVLSVFKEIGIGVAYQLNGKVMTDLPFDFDHPDLKPVTEKLPGWKVEISTTRDFLDLPGPVQLYVERLQSLLGRPISFVSTGPERDALIAMNDFARVVS
jgi:adenylosuccinate synthase